MYKLRLWGGPAKDLFIKKNGTIVWEENGHQYDAWSFVYKLEEASELTIEWIQKNIGVIIDAMCPERVEILQVREHAE